VLNLRFIPQGKAEVRITNPHQHWFLLIILYFTIRLKINFQAQKYENSWKITTTIRVCCGISWTEQAMLFFTITRQKTQA